MAAESVKVAVRVRPFSQREKTGGSKCIISMNKSSTTIHDPQTGGTKTFTFDHSHWSHDGYKVNEKGIFEPESQLSPYSDQKKVFEDLGRGVVQNAMQGYNAALFAYGQTGSGKSYTMVGYGSNKGLVPMTCEELLRPVHENKNNEIQYQVTFSMLEIYNEQVRDLQVPFRKRQHEGLKIRQHPKSGFYVEGLKRTPVQSYAEIERLMNQGTVNRTTAATNMNETSSRSHMVITVNFKKVFPNASGESTTKTSEVHLVDLAGSERVQSTGATGDRLKEAGAINQSLLTLGNVISSLAEMSTGKKNVIVPYRDSALTKLLQAALGGNSKTIMVAALSPAAMNYEETLSTLRYADRAKRIQNKAKINESPTDKLIRELKEENAKLMSQLMNTLGGGRGAAAKTDDLEKLLQENERQMAAMQQTWEQRLEDARREWETQQKQSQHHEKDEASVNLPYLHNINEDTQLSGVIKLFLPPGENVLGRPGEESVTIGLRGLGIQKQHAILRNTGTTVSIEPRQQKAGVTVNGKNITANYTLKHLDRLKLGSNSLYLYVGFPNERKPSDDMNKYDHDFFQTELAEGAGGFYSMAVTSGGQDSVLDAETQLVFSEFIDLMPKIQEANTISEELRTGVTFEAEIKNLALHDASGEKAPKEVLVRVTNQFTNKIWMWTKEKFINRRFLMSELYNIWLDGEPLNIEQSNDPFWDPVEDLFVASCHVWLNSLAYSLDSDDHVPLLNHRGKEEGRLHVKLQPCDSRGNLLRDEDIVVFDPADLIGKQLYFQLHIPAAHNLLWITNDNSRGSYLKFSFNNKPESVSSGVVWNSANPEFEFLKQFNYQIVTKDLLDYLQNQALVIELWGTQSDTDTDGQPETQGPVERRFSVQTSHGSLNRRFSVQSSHGPVNRRYSVQSSHNQENLHIQIRELKLKLQKKDEELKKIQEEARNLQIERDHLLRSAQNSPPFLLSGHSSPFSFSRQISVSSQHSVSPNSSRSKLPYVYGESFGSHTDPRTRRASDIYSHHMLSPTSGKKISVVMPMVSSSKPQLRKTSAPMQNTAQQRNTNTILGNSLQNSPYGVSQRGSTPRPQSQPRTSQRRGSSSNSSQLNPGSVQRPMGRQSDRVNTPYGRVQTPKRRIGVSQTQGPMKATENFHKNDRTATSKVQKRSVGSKRELTPEQTLDIELASALKVFFRDVNDVKNKVEGIKALGSQMDEHISAVNLQELRKRQEAEITGLDDSLSRCVDEFKQSVLTTIKNKRRPSVSNTR